MTSRAPGNAIGSGWLLPGIEKWSGVTAGFLSDPEDAPLAWNSLEFVGAGIDESEFRPNH